MVVNTDGVGQCCNDVKVDWDEYYQHYLRDRLGLAEAEISRMKDNPATSTISRDVQESLANVKAAWSEVRWEIFVYKICDGSPSQILLFKSKP